MKRRKRRTPTPTPPTPTPDPTPEPKPQPIPDPGPPPDPSIPINDPKIEHFLALLVKNHTQTDAYTIAINPKIKRDSARSCASVLMARPGLAARLALLRSEAKQKPTAPTTPTAPEPQPEQPQEETEPIEGYLTLDEAKERITKAVRTAKTSTDITQALKLAKDVLGLSDEDKPPDPVTIIRYVTQAAGRPHPEIVQEMGGLRWMLERVVEFAKVPPSHVRKVIRKWDRDLHADQQGIQSGIHSDDTMPDSLDNSSLLSDNVSDNAAEGGGTGDQAPTPTDI